MVGGALSDDIFDCCYNGGDLIAIGGVQYVGGMVGDLEVDNCSLNNCYNIGNIKLSDTDLRVNCGGIVGRTFGSRLENCHNNSQIFIENLDYEENKIGFFTGYAYENGVKCFAENCSVLMYENLPPCGDFDGNYNDILKVTDEEDMPNILDVLGDKFKMGIYGYPILNWQVED